MGKLRDEVLEAAYISAIQVLIAPKSCAAGAFTAHCDANHAIRASSGCWTANTDDTLRGLRDIVLLVAEVAAR